MANNTTAAYSNMTFNPILYDEELQVYYISYSGFLLASSLCSIIFIRLLLLDAWKAFKRKAHWIPGQLLVLSALTIQVLTYMVHLNLNLNSKDRYAKDAQIAFAVEDQLVMDCRRVIVCVFIAYLIPGMARRGFRTVWGDIGALTLGVIFHMTYDLYSLLGAVKEDSNQLAVDTDLFQLSRDYRAWLIPSYILLSTSIIMFLGLLISAVIAGTTISKLMSQKVPLALPCCCGSPENSKCKNIEDHVLKCWIVLRASQPEYIVARSVLSASVGLLLAVTFVLLVIKWVVVPIPKGHYLQKGTFALQLLFVLVGSLVVVMRWLTAVFYFPRKDKDVVWLFCREDFWTRSLVDMKEDKKGFESLLLTIALWAQTLIVSLGKLSWALSQFVFAIIRIVFSTIWPSTQMNISHQFSNYIEALEIIRLPGETPERLWIANERAFKQTENHIEQGLEEGRSRSAELISLLREKTGSPEDEATTSMQEDKYFKEVAEKSWKMRGVSLIHFMMFFYDENNSAVINDSILAFSQAWKFLDIVDNSVRESKLVSLVADKEFKTLELFWKKFRKMQHLENPKKRHEKSKEKGYKLLDEKIRNPIREIMEPLSKGERVGRMEGDSNLHDSMDWKTVAAKLSLSKIAKAANLNLDSNPGVAIHELRCLLANIIVHCMENELDIALVERCNHWAEVGKENEILDAAFIAGKAKGVRQCGEGKEGVEGKHTVQDQV